MNEPGISKQPNWEVRNAAGNFLQYINASSQYAFQTVRAYASDLNRFFNYLEATHAGCTPQDITPAIVQDYRDSVAHLKATTVSRKLCALSRFFDWLWVRGDVLSNPVTAVKHPRRKREETKWVTAEDGLALLAACRNHRERAILATYLRAALRYSELMQLRVKDVDLVRDELQVLGKGGLRRAVPILSDLRPYLVEWLAVRPHIPHNYLFTTRTGNPLYEKACWRFFRRLLKKAGLEDKDYAVHSLRHGAATQMYEAGVDLGTVARFLRHSDTNTVMRYVHAGTAVVRRQVEERLQQIGPLPAPSTQISPVGIEVIVSEIMRQLVHQIHQSEAPPAE